MWTKFDPSLALSGHTVTANGRTFPVDLHIETAFDDSISTEEIMSWDGLELAEREALIRKCDRGDVTPCIIRVVATVAGMPFEGDDCMGGTMVERPSDVDDAVADHGMVATAVAELQTAIVATLQSDEVRCAKLRRFA